MSISASMPVPWPMSLSISVSNLNIYVCLSPSLSLFASLSLSLPLCMCSSTLPLSTSARGPKGVALWEVPKRPLQRRQALGGFDCVTEIPASKWDVNAWQPRYCPSRLLPREKASLFKLPNMAVFVNWGYFLWMSR